MIYKENDVVMIPEEGTYQGVRRKWKVVGQTKNGYVFLTAPGMDEVPEQATVYWDKLLLWKREDDNEVR